MFIRNLCALLFVFTAYGAMGQKIIDRPAFEGRVSGVKNITRIELSDTATILHVEGVYRPNWWIWVDSVQYIVPSDGGGKLKLKYAEGIGLSSRFVMPASGRHPFKLFFPPLPGGVSRIDWVDADNDGTYGISLAGSGAECAVPCDWQGNWVRTDGSGVWDYSFGKYFAVAGGEFWDYAKVKGKGASTEFYLKNGKNKKVVYARREKDGRMLLGESKNDLKEYSRKRTADPAVVRGDSAGFDSTVLTHGKAVLKGFVRGYVPQMGKRKATVYVENVFLGRQELLYMDIEPDGRFYFETEMDHPGPVLFRFPFRMDFSVFLEPGKETLMCVDMEQYIDPYRDAEDVSARPKTSLFSGANALLNYEIQECKPLLDLNYRRLQNVVKVITSQQFKEYVYRDMETNYQRLAEYEKANGLSRKGKEFFAYSMNFNIALALLDYDYFLEENWKLENKGKKNEDIEPFQKPELGIMYYDFIRKMNLEDVRNVVAGSSFAVLVNRIRYHDLVRSASAAMKITEVVSEMKASGIRFSEREAEFLELLRKLQESNGQDTALLNQLSTNYQEDNTLFNEKYGQQMADIYQRGEAVKKKAILELYFGIKPGLVTALIDLHEKAGKLSKSFIPLTGEELDGFAKSCSVSYVTDCLLRYNDHIKATIEANKQKTGYTLNEAPAVENDKLFGAILEPFKGKVVFVDFWATWCAPCRDGIQRMKGIKEELKDKDIVFVYITGTTSPSATYKNMIPDIKGQHFRLSADQWDYLGKRFNMTGIPHYILVDKEGNITDEKYNAWKAAEEVKADLLKLLRKK